MRVQELLGALFGRLLRVPYYLITIIIRLFNQLAKLYFILNPFTTNARNMGLGNIYKRRMKVFTLAFLIYIDYKIDAFPGDIVIFSRVLNLLRDGEMIIDTAAGMLGKYDPRPVQPDSLFPVFSVTKGVTAGMVHWLADKGKLKLDENVANFWPEFGTNGKDQIKVSHILNHTSGLHNALAAIPQEDPMLFCDWDECLKRIAEATPETEPGREQLYHYLSYGWLCGGVVEHASGKKFQDVLEEAFVRPLNVEGELYIGIPPGVESRLATLTLDTSVFSKLPKPGTTSTSSVASTLPSTFTFNSIAGLIPLSNTLNVRRAILPAANGHLSARALCRYYAALLDGGVVPPRHSSSSLPTLGSHPHHPAFPSIKTRKDRNPKPDHYILIPETETETETETKGYVRLQLPKLRRFLVELGNADKILGIQVCAYKDGQVIIDTAAGVLGRATPETEPGREQLYHYLSYGWLCGGIIEHASGKKFQDILNEAFVRPLNLEGELYIGIPPEDSQICYNQGDHVALLSAFAEMGLKLRLDMPEQAMEVTNVFFRATTPAAEALETVKNLTEQRAKD
nr:hypothetical protein [Tanacetum cinerariifolium]